MRQSTPDHKLDAWRALVRHANFADEPPVIERERVSRLFPSLKATPDERAEYEYELTEHAGRYMDAGSQR